MPVAQSIDQPSSGAITSGQEMQTEILLDLFEQTAFARHGVDRSSFRVRHEQHRELIDECERRGYIRRENHSYFISLLGVSEVARSPEAQRFFTNAESIYLYLQAAYRRNPNEQRIHARGARHSDAAGNSGTFTAECVCSPSEVEGPGSANAKAKWRVVMRNSTTINSSSWSNEPRVKRSSHR